MSLRDELLDRFPGLKLVPPPAWVVGGAVRDLLLGLEPADVDLAVADPLLAARSVSGKPIQLGREPLVAWRVVRNDRTYDFAAIVGGGLDTDLARRDFTINAMAVDLASGDLLDPHRGRDDLSGRVIRMIDPSNFDDDPLRMLRGVRMAVALDFSLDPATVEAIRSRAAAIHSSAGERIGFELSLMFSAHRLRRAITLLRETGLDRALLGEPLDASAAYADGTSLAASLAFVLRDARTLARKWRLSSQLLNNVLTLQRLLVDHSLVALFVAGEDVASQLPALLRATGKDGSVPMPDFTLRPLLDGNDIRSLTGLPEGPDLGALVRRLTEAQTNGKVTTREEAEAFVRLAQRS